MLVAGYAGIGKTTYTDVLHATIVLAPIQEDYRAAYAFGLLALRQSSAYQQMVQGILPSQLSLHWARV
jgi:hypothetical protein